jgi:hypothetical protein
MAAMGGAGGPAPPGYTLPNAKLTEEERWEKSIWDQLKGVDTDSIPGIQAINAEIDRLHGLITGTEDNEKGKGAPITSTSKDPAYKMATWAEHKTRLKAAYSKRLRKLSEYLQSHRNSRKSHKHSKARRRTSHKRSKSQRRH